MQTNRPRILTWHIHGSYLYYLTQTACEFYIPVKEERPDRYIGLPEGDFPWGENAHEIAAEKIKELDFDCILFQSQENYTQDQYEVLSAQQLSLPKVYLEHDPPRETPTDTKHIVDDPDILLVHVTHFNNVFWDNNQTPTTVIEHGVSIPKDIQYVGNLRKGIVVVNNLQTRGRRLGLDIFESVKKHIPVDIIGINSQYVGGLGEISHQRLPSFLAHYRFFFHPIRYTSLGLAACEAMMIGLPIVGLSTTEMPDVIENGKEGFLHNDIATLIQHMQELLNDKAYAKRLSQNAKNKALKKFHIKRFVEDWEDLFQSEIQKHKRKALQHTMRKSIGGIL